MIPHHEHVKHAEALIAKAHQEEGGQRCHLAKTYALMASAHIDIAREMRESAISTPIVQKVDVGGEFRAALAAGEARNRRLYAGLTPEQFGEKVAGEQARRANLEAYGISDPMRPCDVGDLETPDGGPQ